MESPDGPPAPCCTLRSVQRPVALVLASLSLFLLVFPLTLEKPGLPPVLKADEPAYYLMALSLARDGDLRLGLEDTDRLFEEFPYRRVDNLIVLSTDGWRTAQYGKPYVYSLFAAPLAGPFGADGMLLFNMILLVGMIWIGTSYLRRWNPPWLAALFSSGFFLLSAAFAYAFWLQPEIFNMACVALALWLGFHDWSERARSRMRGLLLPFLSGAALMPAVYAKPMIAALALPLLWVHLRDRRWGRAGAWVAGAVLSLGLFAGLSVALTGEPTAYLGVERQGVTVCEEDVLPFERPDREVAPGGVPAGADRSPTRGAWSWIFRVPDVDWNELAANLGFFLWGRHTGLALYMPFAVLALVLFALHGRRASRLWMLLASLAIVALFFLLFIPFNWQGGGGFVGNRYFVNVYPAFLFLVTRLRPRALVPVAYAVGGLFLGPVVLTQLGAAVPEPTMQFHTRNPPFTLFPVEHTLRQVPGYHTVKMGDLLVMGRKDQVLPRGQSLWLRGADRVELWVKGREPLERGVFQVRSSVPDNRVRLEIGRDEEAVEVGPGTPGGAAARVTLEPDEPGGRFTRFGNPFVVHEMEVTVEEGRSRSYTKHFPPNPCPEGLFGYDASREETFFFGADLTYLGSGEALDADVFAVAWEEVEVRRRVPAGGTFHARVRLRNASSETWRSSGSAGVSLSYHWFRPVGEGADDAADAIPAGVQERVVRYDGLRSPLPLPVAPGEEVEVLQEIEAPAEPGRYVLALDPIFEHVSWFSRRGVEPYRVEVTVVEEN